MDNGAHFHRCDFQVHTPRDLNWNGARPTNDPERVEFSKLFIKSCREKGLDAVAITDHHDTAFFRFIVMRHVQNSTIPDHQFLRDNKL